MTDQVLLDGLPRIDLADLIEDLKEKDQRSLSEAIEAYQEKLLDELCGLKYNPKPNGVYRRAGSNRRPKTIVTPLGIVRFKTWKVKNHATGETITPILYILQVPRRKYTRQVKAECAELTSKLSYGDTREEYHRLTGVLIPKSTIHGFTREIAPGMLEAQLNTQPQPQGLVILADGTEVRAVKTRQHNQVRVALSVRDDSKRLFNLTVNEPYSQMPRGSILVSDGEPDLKHQDPDSHQICILHP